MKRMQDMPETQQPYEKCLKNGAEALSDSELLAVILRCGTYGANSVSLADQILTLTHETAYPGLPGLLHLSPADLMNIKGIGRVKAIQLKCIGELSKRLAATAARPGITLNQPKSIAVYFMERLRHAEQEHLYCMMFDTKNHLLKEQLLSVGTVSGTMISPREIFLEALKYHASFVVLVHNHPSGDPAPSRQDIDLTQRVLHTGSMLGIPLQDHIIIGDQRYCSFVEEGLFGST